MITIVTLILALLFLPWPWDLVVVAVAAVFEVCLAVFGIRYSRKRHAKVGVQTMIGSVGEAITTLAPRGQVKVGGEIWEARAESVIHAGAPVTVLSVKGLTLDVAPAETQ